MRWINIILFWICNGEIFLILCTYTGSCVFDKWNNKHFEHIQFSFHHECLFIGKLKRWVLFVMASIFKCINNFSIFIYLFCSLFPFDYYGNMRNTLHDEALIKRSLLLMNAVRFEVLFCTRRKNTVFATFDAIIFVKLISPYPISFSHIRIVNKTINFVKCLLRIWFVGELNSFSFSLEWV